MVVAMLLWWLESSCRHSGKTPARINESRAGEELSLVIVGSIGRPAPDFSEACNFSSTATGVTAVLARIMPTI